MRQQYSGWGPQLDEALDNIAAYLDGEDFVAPLGHGTSPGPARGDNVVGLDDHNRAAAIAALGG